MNTTFQDAIDAVVPVFQEFDVKLQPVEKVAYAGRVEYLTRGLSRYVRLSIWTEQNQVFLSIAPRDYRNGSGLGEKWLDTLLLNQLGIKFEHKRVRPQEMRGEVERQVRLLIEHFRSILEGDYSLWPEPSG